MNLFISYKGQALHTLSRKIIANNSKYNLQARIMQDLNDLIYYGSIVYYKIDAHLMLFRPTLNYTIVRSGKKIIGILHDTDDGSTFIDKKNLVIIYLQRSEYCLLHLEGHKRNGYSRINKNNRIDLSFFKLFHNYTPSYYLKIIHL